MDINASDPILVAAQQIRQAGEISRTREGRLQTSAPSGGSAASRSTWLVGQSADIMELCRVFLLNAYLKHLGRARLFELLQREHERHNLATGRAFVLLAACFLLTWLVQADFLAVWRTVAGFIPLGGGP